MNDITTQWVIPTITNLIAALIIWGCGTLLARSKLSMNTVKGVASSATRKMVPIVLNAAQYVFLFWFFVTQLRSLLTGDTPPSRVESFLIAFWTWWALMLFFRLLAGRRWFAESGESKAI